MTPEARPEDAWKHELCTCGHVRVRHLTGLFGTENTKECRDCGCTAWHFAGQQSEVLCPTCNGTGEVGRVCEECGCLDNTELRCKQCGFNGTVNFRCPEPWCVEGRVSTAQLLASGTAVWQATELPDGRVKAQGYNHLHAEALIQTLREVRPVLSSDPEDGTQ